MPISPQRLALALLLSGSAPAAVSEQPVVGGPGNDYQASVIPVWGQAQRRIAVFERLDGTFSGDLWLSSSEDGGDSWSAPLALVFSSANERHASLVQTAADAFLLLYLSDASGGFRIHRATSSNGSSFVERGAIDLGWVTPGEINPQLTRESDGSLTLVYQRLGAAAHLARSTNGGETWDLLQTQISPANAALPRLTRRPGDGRYLLFYQTGSSSVALWAKTSSDPYDWSSPAVPLVPDGNNHDAWPLVTADGRFAVFWARVVDDAFQIHVSHSSDGGLWSEPVGISNRPGLKNVQPFALPTALGGQSELYWGAGQVSGDADYDIVRLERVQIHQPTADLSVQGAALDDQVSCGSEVFAGFELGNAGPSPTSIQITFSSNSAGGLAAVAPPDWVCATQEAQLECSLATMIVGETALFEIAGDSQPEDCGGQVALTATVQSQLSEDPNPADNLAVVKISVLPAPPLPVALLRDGFEAPL